METQKMKNENKYGKVTITKDFGFKFIPNMDMLK